MQTNHPSIASIGVDRPTEVRVDLDVLTANFQAIDRHVGAATVMPIVKANAYGHGLIEVGLHLERIGAARLGVAYLEEAVLLREAGVQCPILVLGGILSQQIPVFFRHDVTFTVPSVDKLRELDEAAGSAGVVARAHLKVDTGMERIGVHWYSAEKLFEAALGCRNVVVEGVFSHFAAADSGDLTSARRQVERFDEAMTFFEDRSLEMPLRHMANSGAILQLPEAHYDLVRAGIMLYGVYPSRECGRTVTVEPALEWHSSVVYFKVVEAGSPVSYDGTWVPDHQVRVVTLPVGYGDGYFRTMSGSAEVLIRGRRYPVVGRICMDQIMVNIEWDSAYNGDQATLIGVDGSERITCDDLAAWAGTIPYEVLTNINARVPRVYTGGSL